VNAARNRQFDKAKVRGDELLAISEELGDEDLKFEALHHRWGFAYFTGQTANMLAYAAEGVRRYEPARHHRFSYTFAGHDPGVCADCIRAMGLSVAGDTAKIKPELEAALALSDRLQHPMSALFARGFMCNALYLTRDLDACRASANEMLRLATKYDLPAYGAIGSFWLGATQAMHGDLDRADAWNRHQLPAALVAPCQGFDLIRHAFDALIETRPVADEHGVAAFVRSSNDGLIVTGSPTTALHREATIALAARYRLPAVYPYRFHVTAGGLISYGPDVLDQYRRAAGYVDRILKGEKPGDLPVQTPTKYEVVLNLKTAKALGLEIPPTLLAFADDVRRRSASKSHRRCSRSPTM
jgi:hypothetical protein